jgi:hypothetical protein
MPITFPLTRLTIVAEIALGADLTADPATWSWTNITAYVRQRAGIQLTRGKRDEGSQVDPATARLNLDNRDGRFVRRNPSGAYTGQLSKNTPIRIGVNPGDGIHYRFHGFVNEWPTRWTKDQRDSTVPVTCAGILRRLAHNRRLGSPLFRTMAGVAPGDYVPYAYWPMEDGTNATRFAPGVVGGTSLAVPSGASPAAMAGPSGSAALAELAAGRRLPFTIPTYSSTQIAFQWLVQVPSEPAAEMTLAEFYASSGPVRRWKISIVPGAPASLFIRDYDSAGTEINAGGVTLDGSSVHNPAESAVFGQWVMLLFAPQQTGGNVSSWLGIAAGAPGGAPGYANVDAGTLGVVTGGFLYGGEAGCGVGHLVAYTDTGFDLGFTGIAPKSNVAALDGYDGELAHVRLARLCHEESVSLTTSATTSAAMGPQQSGTLLDALRECETADQGILYELEFGLGYLSLTERYNTASVLDLDFRGADIAEPPEPADDDQQTVNMFTASRPDGSFATVQDATSVAADGLYAGSGTFNVELDEQLVDIASWKVHVGTVDEDRWPAIPIRLARTPGRITSWVAVGIGSEMTVANPPSQMSPATIVAVVEGWAEAFNPYMWEAVLNTSPASSFTVGEWDDAGSLWGSAIWAI